MIQTPTGQILLHYYQINYCTQQMSCPEHRSTERKDAELEEEVCRTFHSGSCHYFSSPRKQMDVYRQTQA